MKTGIFVPLSLLGLAAARPQHGHRHAGLHEKRQAVVTEIQTVYTTAPAAVVYVGQNGQIMEGTPEKPTSAPVVVAAVPTTTPEATTTRPPPPPPSTSSTIAAPAASPNPPTKGSGSSGGSSGSSNGGSQSSTPPSDDGTGIAYSPYNNDGTCKSQDQVNADFEQMNGYSVVRSYGVDCDQVNTIMTAAKAKGMKVFLGIFNIQPASQLSADITTLVSAVGGDWSSVHSISIGNEDVNQGKAQPADVVDATNSGRTQLRAAGFQGPVVHVDTFNQLIAHPELCGASDYAAANCHAFFSDITPASAAGDYVQTQAGLVKAACGGKETYITESGWPHQGDANGAAIPSPENQSTALSGIKSAMGSNVFVFSAFDTLWKQNGPGTFNAEQYWGFLN